MAKEVNRQWLLASRPKGTATAENFRLREAQVPAPEEGEVLVRTLYLSVDPYMRGRMNEQRSYAEPARLGEVMPGGIVGRVVESRLRGLQAGEIVLGHHGWQDYGVSRGEELTKLTLPPELLPAALGALGMPGLTAWYGLLEIGKPAAGETVVVSGAAGAVGSVVGQIAKLKGCRAVGIAGSAEKVRWLEEELGFDKALDYRSAGDLAALVGEACPKGVDVYFDNVGGDVTNAVLPHLATFARIVVCGQISSYNLALPRTMPSLLPLLLTKRALAQGFIVGDHGERLPEGLGQLRRWIEEGRIRHRETIVEGLENAPAAFLGLFRGENIGKQVVRVARLA